MRGPLVVVSEYKQKEQQLKNYDLLNAELEQVDQFCRDAQMLIEYVEWTSKLPSNQEHEEKLRRCVANLKPAKEAGYDFFGDDSTTWAMFPEKVKALIEKEGDLEREVEALRTALRVDQDLKRLIDLIENAQEGTQGRPGQIHRDVIKRHLVACNN